MTTTGQPALSLRGIDKAFAGVPVLRGIDCDFFPGEVHCLMGENGAGKSTLIKIISGAYGRDHGTITLEGQPVERHSPAWARTHGIATIYQELDLIPNLSAAENVFLGVEPRNALGLTNRRELARQTVATLAEMGVSLDVHAPVADLGVASQQMVAIAKAMVLRCKVLILDEPTAVFTSSEKETLFRLVRAMRARSIAIIFISHHMEEIFEIGDRITVLRDGTVASTGLASEYDHDRLVRHMVGRDIVRPTRNRESVSAQRVLEVRGLSDADTVRDVSFHVDAGEIVGVAGLVGAGRSEMAGLLFGSRQKTAGEILLHDRPVAPRTPAEALKLKIGMVPEDRKRDGLALERPAGENLGYPLVRKLSRLGIVPWSRIYEAVRAAFKDLSVRPSRPTMQAGRMSGGNQQKLMLGRWLTTGSDLLILDEPTRGVDIGARTEIYGLIQELRRQGKAILMISSDLTEILSQSDRILVMSKGRLVGELSGDAATEEAVLSLALRNYTEASDK